MRKEKKTDERSFRLPRRKTGERKGERLTKDETQNPGDGQGGRGREGGGRKGRRGKEGKGGKARG